MIPQTPRSLFMNFCISHSPIFVANAASIGVTNPAASAFATLTTDTAAALEAAETARNAAKAATAYANSLVKQLKGNAASIVTTIRLFAEASADPAAVYLTANLPSPAVPTPVPAPAQPTDLTITIDPVSGEPTIKWKASNPANGPGTSYIVRRKLPGESAFSFLGVASGKVFTDTTLFAGPDSVQYTVQGTRSGLNGPLSPILTVNFGRAPDGGLTAFAVGSGGEGKLAA